MTPIEDLNAPDRYDDKDEEDEIVDPDDDDDEPVIEAGKSKSKKKGKEPVKKSKKGAASESKDLCVCFVEEGTRSNDADVSLSISRPKSKDACTSPCRLELSTDTYRLHACADMLVYTRRPDAAAPPPVPVAPALALASVETLDKAYEAEVKKYKTKCVIGQCFRD